MVGIRVAGRAMAARTSTSNAVMLLLGVCLGSLLQTSKRIALPDAFAFPWAASKPSLQYTPQRQSREPHRRSQSRMTMNAGALIGTEAPNFKVKAVIDQEFQDMSLDPFRGKKYIVLFFYPLDFTFVCPTEIIAFSDRHDEFAKLNTQVLGVSVDSEYSHLAWIQQPREEGGLGDIEYPLLADLKKEIATAYGVLGPDGAAFRGLFIIDKEGIVQHATVNNMSFGRDVDEVLRVLQAIQHVQANPDEVCPAGWQPGDDTITPDPVGSKEYFKNL